MQRKSLQSYDVITGPSGSGKTRVNTERVWSENFKHRLVAAVFRGAHPELTLTSLTSLITGPAHRSHITSTAEILRSHETVASYLALDDRLFNRLTESLHRCCPFCVKDFEHIDNPHKVIDFLDRTSDGFLTCSARVPANSSNEYLTSLGYIFASDTQEFRIDENIDIKTDRLRFEEALFAIFEEKFVRIMCRSEVSGRCHYFSPQGSCPWCGTIEPKLRAEQIDLRMNVADFNGSPAFKNTRGFTRCEDDLRLWLPLRKVDGLRIQDLLEGFLGNIPSGILGEPEKLLVEELNLESLPILRNCSSLATSELTKLHVLRSLLLTAPGESLVIDGASLALDNVAASAVEECISQAAYSKRITVIDNDWHFREEAHTLPVKAQEELAGSVASSNKLEDGYGKVILVLGPPACGKSTFIRSHLSQTQELTCFLLLAHSRSLSREALVYEYLGLDAILAKLFASSVEAKSLGLDTSRFRRTARTKHRDFCTACRGHGRSGFDQRDLSPYSTCQVCFGQRIFEPVCDIHYRSLTLLDFWNLSLKHATEILGKVSVFAKYHEVIQYLSLDHVVMGTPLGDCSEGERYRLLALKSVVESKTPTIFVFEHPSWRLDDAQCERLNSFLRWVAQRGHSVIVETQDARIVGDLSYSMVKST
jgi:hypothetical protein